MANVVLSDAEKLFIIHGVEDDIRNDGRSTLDYRDFSVETSVVASASGSSRVRVSNTDIMVGVKAELDVPDEKTPSQGKIDFNIDCSALASPRFEGREGRELGVEIYNALHSVYVSGSAMTNLEKLGIVSGKHCWLLNVDVVILECAGSLYDAISLGVKSALFDTQVPVVEYNEESEEVAVESDVHQQLELDFTCCPLLVTVSKVGQGHVVDSSLEEEACCHAQLVMGVDDKGQVSGVRKYGPQSLAISTVCDMINTATHAGVQLNTTLMHKLTLES